MYLVVCPACRFGTVCEDDLPASIRCSWCLKLVATDRARVICDRRKMREHLRSVLQGPAILLVFYGMGQCLGAFVVGGLTDEGAVLAGVSSLVVFLLGCLISAGGLLLAWQRMWLLCVAAGWLTVFSPFLLGLPLGVCVLSWLHRSGVRALFAGSKALDV